VIALDAPEGKLIVNPSRLEECNSTLSDFFLATTFLPGSPSASVLEVDAMAKLVGRDFDRGPPLVVDATAELVGLDFDRGPPLVVDATAELVGLDFGRGPDLAMAELVTLDFDRGPALVVDATAEVVRLDFGPALVFAITTVGFDFFLELILILVCLMKSKENSSHE